MGIPTKNSSTLTSIRQPLQSGYNSHYVIVKRNGETPEFPISGDFKEKLYDEIVINQESQICPAYLLKLSLAKMATFMDTWNRAKPERKISSNIMNRDDMYVPLTEM